MRFVNWNVALATWLLISAFALGNTPTSMLVTAVAAFLVPVVALFAGARPGARYVISVLALCLATLMLFLPSVTMVARISTWITTAAIFALSLVNPRHTHMESPAH